MGNLFSSSPPAYIVDVLSTYKQSHLVSCWSSLSQSERKILLKHIEAIDFHRVYKKIIPKAINVSGSSADAEPAKYSPFPVESLCRVPTVKQKASFKSLAAKVLSSDQFACLLLAGGQGTRLGYDKCKGSFVIDEDRGWSLFDYIINRGKKQGCSSWWIMTSPMNHEETIAYFELKSYYGLGADSFNFFSQGVLPCLSSSTSSEPTDYKVILSSPSSIAFAPDGNGGVYNSLVKSGMLQKMKKEGIVSVHCFSVDNVLVKPADPTFVGFCMSIGADVGNKVLWKSSPDEEIGVMARDEKGRSCVVEYSDMCDADKRLKDKSGGLVYGAGNVCNHYYTLEFLERLLETEGGVDSAVTYHVAKKKIPHFDGNKVVQPETINGIKLETFIFDVFPLSKKMAVLEVQREDEFAPVKNKDDPSGKVVVADSPRVARNMISALSKKWIISHAGKKKKEVTAALKDFEYCEVAPTVSYEGEGITGEMVQEVLEKQSKGHTSVVFE